MNSRDSVSYVWQYLDNGFVYVSGVDKSRGRISSGGLIGRFSELCDLIKLVCRRESALSLEQI